jgi:hypothetical protein
MIRITPHMRILVAVEPVDFRRGIDGLARLCRRSSSTVSGFGPKIGIISYHRIHIIM